ncbi:MAG: methylmalonyl-CoA mutase family protein [Chloroflexota bacterium]
MSGGATKVQELASIIAAGKEHIRELLRRGVDIDTMGRKFTVNFSYCYDFFEDIAAARAARRIWARMMKEEFGATDPRAMVLKHHAIVSGSDYARQRPLLNIARGTVRALSAVLAGCMGIQLAAYDEALSTPTEDGHRVSIGTQQVLRYETGVARVADPLAGSYYVEWLTSRLEEEIRAMVKEIEDRGGWLAVLMSDWYKNQVTKTAVERQWKTDSGERLVVGVNCFTIPPEEDFHPKAYTPDKADVEQYIAGFKEFKRKRDNSKVKKALETLRRAAEKPDENLLPYTEEAILADATFPEIVGVLRMVDGLPYDYAGVGQYPFSQEV